MIRSIGLVLLLSSNLMAAATVNFEELSPFGDHNIYMKISVQGVDPTQYNLVVSSAAQGVGFWDKDPNGYSPSIVPIDSNGIAEISYHTWADTKLDSIATNFAAALYPKSAFPLPSNTGSAGIPNYGYTAIAYTERWGQTVNFSGYQFGLKTSQAAGYSPSQVGPGGNVFLPSAVYQNGDGTTHLTVNNSVCSEMVLANPLGYGTYTSTFNLNNLFNVPGVTFGAFLFDVDGDLSAINKTREIDFEAGDVAVKNGGVFQNVLQPDPYAQGNNINTVNMPTSGNIRSTITWRPGRIDFSIENLSTASTQSWTYTGNRLPADPGHAQYRFNAWISDKAAYNNSSTPVDITLQSFAFTPLLPLPTPATQAWKGGNGNSWSQPSNWQTISETRPDGYGQKIIFGMDIADPATDSLAHQYGCWSTVDTDKTIGTLEFDGHFAVTGFQGGAYFTMDNGNDVGQEHDAEIIVKNGAETQANIIGNARLLLNNNLRITIEDAADQLTIGSVSNGGLISGPGALIIDAANRGTVILAPGNNFGVNTYTGGTFVEGGILEIMEGGLPAHSSLSVTNGGTVNATSINCSTLLVGLNSNDSAASVVGTNQVPEPNSIVLLSLAVLSVLVFKTRRQRISCG